MANPPKVTLWHALRDVLIASMNKGLFLPTVAFLTTIAMILKMPAQDVSRLAFEILKKLENGDLVGYVLSVLLTSGWYVHSKYQRRSIVAEQRRISEERNEWQNRALRGNIESSEKPRKRGKR
jgi:hypothetical protein